jgi:hypothetical protein
MQLKLNEKFFENEQACEELIKKYGNKVTLKNISNDYMPGAELE